jgi:hypothetical protein
MLATIGKDGDHDVDPWLLIRTRLRRCISCEAPLGSSSCRDLSSLDELVGSEGPDWRRQLLSKSKHALR